MSSNSAQQLYNFLYSPTIVVSPTHTLSGQNDKFLIPWKLVHKSCAKGSFCSLHCVPPHTTKIRVVGKSGNFRILVTFGQNLFFLCNPQQFDVRRFERKLLKFYCTATASHAKKEQKYLEIVRPLKICQRRISLQSYLNKLLLQKDLNLIFVG